MGSEFRVDAYLRDGWKKRDVSDPSEHERSTSRRDISILSYNQQPAEKPSPAMTKGHRELTLDAGARLLKLMELMMCG